MKLKVFHDGFEGFLERSQSRAAKRARGERVEETVITFADAADLTDCLSPERIRLFQAVKAQRFSVSELARELGRNRSAVTRDVNKLRKFGLVEVYETINPGHGRIKVVHAVAQHVRMQIAL